MFVTTMKKIIYSKVVRNINFNIGHLTNWAAVIIICSCLIFTTYHTIWLWKDKWQVTYLYWYRSLLWCCNTRSLSMFVTVVCHTLEYRFKLKKFWNLWRTYRWKLDTVPTELQHTNNHTVQKSKKNMITEGQVTFPYIPLIPNAE